MQKGRLGIIVGLFVAAMAGRAEAAKPLITVRVATPFPPGHILADTALRFKTGLESVAGGRFAVQVATSVLTEQTIDPQMTSCDSHARVADVLISGPQPIQDWAPAYFFFNGPYVIKDFDHL